MMGELRNVRRGMAATLLHYAGIRESLLRRQREAIGGPRVVIVGYHRVVRNFAEASKGGQPWLNVSQKIFRKQLEVLASEHDVVTMGEALIVLEDQTARNRDVAVITFDDGYRDVYDHAYPVLREMGLPAVVYVPSNFIGTGRLLAHDRLWTALLRIQERDLSLTGLGLGDKDCESMLAAACGGGALDTLLRLISDNPTPKLYRLAEALETRLNVNAEEALPGQLPMTWEMLREMAKHGIETGAHTAEHTVLTNQPLDEAKREIASCKSTIELNVKRPVRHFAYCNGLYSEGIANALKAEGFVSAVTTEDMPNVRGVDHFALKRKQLWEMSSAGFWGGHSKAVAACLLSDTFRILSRRKAALGIRPTRFGWADGLTNPPSSDESGWAAPLPPRR